MPWLCQMALGSFFLLWNFPSAHVALSAGHRCHCLHSSAACCLSSILWRCLLSMFCKTLIADSDQLMIAPSWLLTWLIISFVALATSLLLLINLTKHFLALSSLHVAKWRFLLLVGGVIAPRGSEATDSPLL